jgi:hypothetical protein
MQRIAFWFLLICLVGGPVNFSRVLADEPVQFDQIKTILSERCLHCHGETEREGGLRFLGQEDLITRNDSGEPAVVPGEADNSELLRRVTNEDERMPPEGEPLTGAEIDLLRRWIDQGADWPDTVRPRHWAYIPPERPPVPTASGAASAPRSGPLSTFDRRTDVPRSPIDAFILEKLAEQGLRPSPPASPAKRLRRVYLDLIGLPPSPEEVDAFLADPSTEHYERIVEKLLSSPQYGEKWARQWLDLARYADSNGFQADQFREIWAYRDWVVKAFNDDMPFDRFTLEQIAGDLLPEPTVEQRIATGFSRCTTCNVEAGVDPEENRTNQIFDRINTTGTVWLGTTLECAQCHNHKYDPFTQQDYYELFAFFNNTPLEVVQPKGMGVQFEVSGPVMELPLEPEMDEKRNTLQQRKRQLEKQIEQRRSELAKVRAEWEEELKKSLQSAPEWHLLAPARFESSGGSTYEILEDQSILLTGEAPSKDIYTVEYETDLAGITGFKLETLTHESLPGNGPGRHHPERPNFVLYEFDVTAGPVASSDDAGTDVPARVGLHSPQADFSQNNWDVAGLIDGDPETGWGINPQFGKPHWASFLTHEPLGFESGTRITVRLPQEYGGGRTMGRFRILAMTGNPGAASIPENVREILALPAEERSKKQNQQLADYHAQTDADVARLTKRRIAVQKQFDEIQPETTLVMVEMNEPRETHIFKRGNFLDPGAPVTPGTPAVLHPFSPERDGERPTRLDFARWLVSPENPLIARVTVNRWWAEFFGRGIVESLEDFGTQGEPPTHPELLDWLAVEFMENGWSIKHVHRLIVTSATYQQDSSFLPASDLRDENRTDLDADPDNQWYARGPRFRMPAEMVRDNALAVSGMLSLKMGGPPVYPPQPPNIWRHVGRNAPRYETDTDEDRFRRGLYVVWRRSAPYPSFVNFDAPDRGACVVNRSRTNTPLQALTLLNDPAYVELAHGLARRLCALGGVDDRQRTEYGFRLALARMPSSEETTHLLEFFTSSRDRFREDPEAAKKLVPDAERLPGVDPAEQAAWFQTANILLNLDETITKD